MPLFAKRDRTDPQTQRAGETTYQFLDRIDDPAFKNVRELFNAWMDTFANRQSAEATKDLLARFRARQDTQFYAAFWELYLHELHARLGFEVTVHPESAKGTRPDFFVSRDGSGFYLEAVMPAPAAGMAQRPASVRTVLEYVNAAFVPDFCLDVRFVSAGKETPRKRAVVAAVSEWLEPLDWDDWWRGGWSAQASYPEAEIGIRDWVIGLRALPRSPASRGDEAFPMIAIEEGMAGWTAAVATGIGPKLDEKATKYGDLDAPHVIAVWVMSPLASEATAPQALFGIEMPLEGGSHPTGLPMAGVERDGLWTANRQRRGRASAVLAASSFTFNYSAVSRVLPRLWLNPWADRPLNVELPFASSRISTDETTIESLPATIDAASLFALPIDWPGRPFEHLRRRDIGGLSGPA